ncbi:N-acetylmannosamine-6-phosphate 2-epimerase [Paenibacillus hemerocallicola]|uniref:Putative N-acetylmannosamine-6-phosphate 2-epimerase n=1 Tax=Paenibacillus hemerocallicola TaxID=1172614 RepID=A0A5C4T1W5_9BACL|nr:N-acetylmannosamine-6-phosphate 2-epimerase [Paenibacillus hemerocallicola]TNJ62876.1 N-acetylmannosamine-6-phosphate 2-epimerase [Paenibacillus hemerocallicola]
MKPIFAQRGLIVSCQALPGEPLYFQGTMARMALAAEQGGAIGIRANGPDDIRDIKAVVKLPVIGLLKRDIPGSDIYITPELVDVQAIIDAGADVVAMDMTNREDRAERVVELIRHCHEAGVAVMADISTVEEGLLAESLGADLISTTMSGYTPYSPKQEGPDLELVRQLAELLKKPLVAEGRIWSPVEAVEALEAGAEYVVVGGAITRPQFITQKYAERLGQWLEQSK